MGMNCGAAAEDSFVWALRWRHIATIC